MKVRISNNSLNIRLQEVEIDSLGKSGLLEAALHFPNNKSLCFKLSMKVQELPIDATFLNDTVEISLSLPTWQKWQASKDIGVEHELSEDGLKILIEKDLKKRHLRNA